MMLRGYIAELQSILDAHGDIPVKRYDTYMGANDARAPKVDHMAILNGRERIPRFQDSSHAIGEKVVSI